MNKSMTRARTPDGHNIPNPLCDHTMAATGATAAAVTRAATKVVGGGDEVGRTTRGGVGRRGLKFAIAGRGAPERMGGCWRCGGEKGG